MPVSNRVAKVIWKTAKVKPLGEVCPKRGGGEGGVVGGIMICRLPRTPRPGMVVSGQTLSR